MASKILVVDDSITIQKIVAMAFEKEDALVEGIGNGSEALVKLKESRPDIVLADVNMPGLNGFELSKKIKESREFDSVSVLLLTSDFEDFNEDNFRDSLADDHITKPFKSEDIVRKVMELLKGKSSSGPMEDDETENVIDLSQTDRVDDETVVELGKDQLMNSMEEFSPEEEEVHLELSDEDRLITPDNSEPEELPLELVEENDEVSNHNVPDDNPAVAVDSSPEAHTKSEKKVPEETLEELIRRVEELSKKSKEFHDQESSEEVLPPNALDEMIKEVNSLKKVSPTVNQEGNGNSPTSLDTDEGDTLVAEVNYISEENTDELEAAFQEILNANKSFSSNLTAISQEEPPIVREDEEIVPEPETLLRDLTTHPFATSLESPVWGPEVETQPHSSQEDQPQEEKNMAIEENYENISEFQSSQEDLFCQLMGKEVRDILEQSLTSSMEKEISGLSEKIMKSVEEIVREIVPGIAKKMINEEIEKIKNKGKG